MGELRTSDGTTVTVRRSRRARRLTLRVSSVDGRVTMTAPPHVRMAELLAFLDERKGWLETAIDRLPTAISVVEGAMLPVEGAGRVVETARVRSPRLSGDGLSLLIPRRVAPGPGARSFLRHLARDRLAEACDRHAGRLGIGFGRIVLRDTRSRWGSCSDSGTLSFSWRLIMAPPPVLDYVAAHEVAHLVEMNHGPDFWAVVARLFPDHLAQRQWLRSEGTTLHRWRFDGNVGM